MRIARLAALALALLSLSANKTNWGPAQYVILYPTSTSSSSGYTLTGAATTHDAVDDAEYSYDDATTYAQHPNDGVTVSRAEFGLTDLTGLVPSSARILYVTIGGRAARGTGAGPSAAATTVGLRISATDYSVRTIQPGSTSYATVLGNNSSQRKTTNPNTSAAWTFGDVDAMQLYITTPTTSNWTVRLTQVYAVVAYELVPSVGTTRERTGGGN